MDIRERKLGWVEDYLSGMHDDQLVQEWNNYQNAICGNEQIYNNDEAFFNEYFENAFDAIKAISFGEYKYADAYVKFDGYGNLESLAYVDSGIDFDDLAEWYLDNEDCEDILAELYEELENEAVRKALNLYSDNATLDLFALCCDIADEFELDADELFDTVNNELN